jgi:hypothetical protein
VIVSSLFVSENENKLNAPVVPAVAVNGPTLYDPFEMNTPGDVVNIKSVPDVLPSDIAHVDVFPDDTFKLDVVVIFVPVFISVMFWEMGFLSDTIPLAVTPAVIIPPAAMIPSVPVFIPVIF